MFSSIWKGAGILDDKGLYAKDSDGDGEHGVYAEDSKVDVNGLVELDGATCVLIICIDLRNYEYSLES